MTCRCPACGRDEAVELRSSSYQNVPSWFACESCSSQFLLPQPDDVRLREIYSPAYYEAWDWERPAVVQASKSATFLRALRLASPQARERLLDVGCAQGEFAAAAVGLDLEVAGVDLNAEAIQRARERVPSAEFYCGELDPTVVGPNWDIVTMFDFIEHVRDPVAVLKRAGTVLGPGGRLLVSTPRVNSLTHKLTGKHWPQYREEHLVLFSRSGLRRALDDAGFEIELSVPTTKSCTAAYLLGQAACYSSPRTQRAVRKAQWVLQVPAMHWLLPLRFGEMTVVARARR